MRSVGGGLTDPPYPYESSSNELSSVYVLGYGEFVTSASISFDFGLGGTNWSGMIFLGDYSDKWRYAHINCQSGTLYRGGSYFSSDSSLSAGPGDELSLSYPFTMYDPTTFAYINTTIPFDGNGVLFEPRQMQGISVSGGTTSFVYTVGGTTNTHPSRPSAPSIPVEGATYASTRLANAQIKGYHTTHLFVILEWDFEYK